MYQLCQELIWISEKANTYCMRPKGHEGDHSSDMIVIQELIDQVNSLNNELSLIKKVLKPFNHCEDDTALEVAEVAMTAYSFLEHATKEKDGRSDNQ